VTARRPARVAVAVVALLLASGTAAADPIFVPPVIGKGKMTADDAPYTVAFVSELSAIAALGVERSTTFPDVGEQQGGTTEFSLRLGLFGKTSWPLDYTVRIDVSEARRVDGDRARDAPMTVVSQFVDDAALWWRPHVAANLIAGRFKVPFSRSRHWDRSELTAAAVPFAVERTAPDRRWGITFLGDLGAIAYAAGAYVDHDDVEPRVTLGEGDSAVVVDPSRGGRAAFAAHLEWTPRAPIRRGFLPEPSSEPWFDVVRVSAGLGTLVRLRAPDRGTRTDLALHGQLKWRRLSAEAEILFGVEPDVFESAATAELAWTPTDKSAFFARGEYERCDERAAAPDRACRDGNFTSAALGRPIWTLGGGATWFVTADRRSKATFVGFFRRDRTGDLDADGAIVQLQTAL